MSTYPPRVFHECICGHTKMHFVDKLLEETAVFDMTLRWVSVNALRESMHQAFLLSKVVSVESLVVPSWQFRAKIKIDAWAEMLISIANLMTHHHQASAFTSPSIFRDAFYLDVIKECERVSELHPASDYPAFVSGPADVQNQVKWAIIEKLAITDLTGRPYNMRLLHKKVAIEHLSKR